MRLKTLKLAGFKSFAEPTRFRFVGARTAIVGPNGCGKSNVIDAIRWVLGESSAKQLRGGAMTDVIFAGSASKRAMSYASVELVFEQLDSSLSASLKNEFNLYHELSVRRQVSSDGRSDYYINGTKCRKKDIVSLFLGTGLGPRSYAVIEQGMISRLVDAKPEELRAHLDEAAGVSKYQSRRTDTQSHLERAKENLDRLTDVKLGLEKQMSRLKRQASEAERYQALTSQLATVEATLKRLEFAKLFMKHSSLVGQLAQAKQALGALETTGVDLEVEAKLCSKALDQLQIERSKAQQAKAQALEENMKAAAKLQDALNAASKLKDEHSSASFKASKTAEELSLINQQFSELQKEALQHEQALTERREAVLRLKDTAPASWQPLSETVHEQAAELRRLTQSLSSLDSEKRMFETQLGRAKRLLEQNTPNQTAEPQQNLELLEQKRAQCAEQKIAQTKQAERFSAETAELEEVHQKAKTAFYDADQRLTQLKAKASAYESMIQSGAKANSKSQNAAHAMQDTAHAALIETVSLTAKAKPHAKVFDLFFAQLGQALSFESLELALSLKAQHSVWPRFEPCQPASGFEHLSAYVDAPSVGRLPLTWVCAAADQLQDKQVPEQVQVLTLDGFLYQGAELIDLKMAPHEPVLEHKAKLAELSSELDALTPVHKKLEVEAQAAKQKLQDQQHVLLQAKQDLEQTSLELLKAESALKEAVLSNKALEDQTKQRLERYEQAKLQHTELTEHVAALDAQAHETKAKQTELQTSLAQLQDQLTSQKTRFSAHEQRSKEAESELSRFELELQKKQLKLQALSAQQNQLEAQRTSLQTRIHELDQKLSTAESDQPLKDYAEQTKAAYAELASRLSELEQSEAKLRQDQNKHTEALDQHRHVLSQKLQQTTELQLEAERAHERMQVLKEQSKVSLETTTDQAKALTASSSFDELSSTQAQLQSKLERIGAVNLVAQQEMKQVSVELDTLNTQMQDVSQSVERLTTAMKQIDEQTKDLFQTTFDQVNAELGRLFPKVFGGGQAQLSLHDPSDWRSGVLLMAQPPGKKNTRLALLSGGEKALTALSLIFAIFKLNPAPFCVLDEVDAPLDDANTKRFCALVEELSDTLQFVFISHNKLAMQMANHLLGVTMQNAGVSKLVEVSLDEASRFES